MNFGGANANAQKKAFYEPFEKTGTKVMPVEYNGEQAKIKAMVETKKVTWDVVEAESPDVARGCDEGLFEKLDYSKIGAKSRLRSRRGDRVRHRHLRLVHRDGLQRRQAQGGRPRPGPISGTSRSIPGKRGMRKGARYNLEFALMADGVKPADVYKVLATKEGADRAFKKLTELKPNIQWWEAGAQPPQFLVAGDVVMTTVYNGRIDAANREGKNLKITWTGGIYDLDYWTIPKGTPNKDAGAEVHRLRQHARRAGRVREEHRLRPDEQEGARQA